MPCKPASPRALMVVLLLTCTTVVPPLSVSCGNSGRTRTATLMLSASLSCGGEFSSVPLSNAGLEYVRRGGAVGCRRSRCEQSRTVCCVLSAMLATTQTRNVLHGYAVRWRSVCVK